MSDTIAYENLAKLNAPFMEAYKEKFQAILEKGWFVLGDEVKHFEEEFATYCGAKYCVGVANGLDALVLSLKALQLPAGSEVITPSNTYIATVLAILHAELVPVLVEPNIHTYNIDTNMICKAITNKTKVIMPVHLYGKIANMKAIMQLAQEHNLKVVSDCAQAHGASLHEKRAGLWADIAAFSFYPTKNLGGLGDAGAIVTNDESYYAAIRTLRNYGSEKKYHNVVVGYNSRLDEIQAGFLRIKLKALDTITAHKRALAEIYCKGIKNADLILPHIEDDFFDVFHIFAIRHKQRDMLKAYLLENNIMSEIHYPIPPHKQIAMRGIIAGEYPIAETIHEEILSLPISYMHTREDIERVIECINSL